MAKNNAGMGRPKGVKNKTTIERERIAAEIAARTVMDARKAGKKLGKEALEDFMNVFGNMSVHFQVTYPEIMAARQSRDLAVREEMAYRENQFIRYAELAIQCARFLAPYQSPTYTKMPYPMDLPSIKTIDQSGNNVIDMRDPIAIARIYRSMMTAEE